MEFNQVVEKRRSIRKYSTRKVEHEKLLECIQCATLAPTWKNSQTGRYYVITNEELLATFKDTCLPEYNATNVKNAPAIIVSTFKANHSGFNKDGTPSNELENGWGFYDLGLQNQNLVLKAVELGLDTLIMGLRNQDKIRELLSVPEDEIIVAVLSVGYRDIEPPMPKRKTIDEIAKFIK